MARRVTVADLQQQTGTAGPHPFLYCPTCGAEYSANAADYWCLPDDYVFRCCRRNMLHVIRESILIQV